jgi:hypothetical protein
VDGALARTISAAMIVAPAPIAVTTAAIVAATDGTDDG